MRREIKGHIANRLWAVLWREAFHLVDQGVATVEDIDTAISQGPGLRWARMGPFMNLHLSGATVALPTCWPTWVAPSKAGGRTWAPRP